MLRKSPVDFSLFFLNLVFHSPKCSNEEGKMREQFYRRSAKQTIELSCLTTEQRNSSRYP